MVQAHRIMKNMNISSRIPYLLLLCAGISPLAVRADYADVVLEDAPIAYWRMDDADGDEVTDSSGNNHHGEVDGAEGSISFGQPGLVPAEGGI